MTDPTNSTTPPNFPYGTRQDGTPVSDHSRTPLPPDRTRPEDQRAARDHQRRRRGRPEHSRHRRHLTSRRHPTTAEPRHLSAKVTRIRLRDQVSIRTRQSDVHRGVPRWTQEQRSPCVAFPDRWRFPAGGGWRLAVMSGDADDEANGRTRRSLRGRCRARTGRTIVGRGHRRVGAGDCGRVARRGAAGCRQGCCRHARP